MKQMTIVMMSYLLLSFSVLAEAGDLKFILDSGTMNLIHSLDASEYKITHTMGQCLKTKLDIVRDGDEVRIKHVGDRCLKGAVVNVKINTHKYRNLLVNVESGVLNAKKIISEFGRVKAKVTYGEINTKRFKPTRKPPMYSAVAIDEKFQDINREIDLNVSSGVIEL